MHKRALLKLLTIGVALIAVPAAAAAATAPTVAITSPVAGQTISKAASDTITVLGNAGFGTPVAADRTFYLRRDDCGGSDNPHLSIVQGSDGGDGCGNLIGGVSAAPETYAAVDGVPFTLDTSRKAHITVVTGSFSGAGGVGNQSVTAKLFGGSGLLGQGSQTILVTPGTDQYTYGFDITLADQSDPVTDLSLELTITGGFGHGFVQMNGASFLDVPIMDTGSIKVSTSSSNFTYATIEDDGTWSAELNTPSAGNRTITALATQGESTASTTVGIKVTA
jgi:hypothetical protein